MSSGFTPRRATAARILRVNNAGENILGALRDDNKEIPTSTVAACAGGSKVTVRYYNILRMGRENIKCLTVRVILDSEEK